MGNELSTIGSSVGDLFYTDNPQRRGRARQLQLDCYNYIEQFNQLKSSITDLEPEIRKRMNAYLKANGFASLDALIKHVNGVLNGAALSQWKALQAQLSREHFINEAILSIGGIVALGSGVVIGGLVLFCVLTGPVGWAVFGGISAVVAVVSIIDLGVSIYESYEERESLREAIDELAFARVKVAQQVAWLQCYKNNLIQFSNFFGNQFYNLNPNIFATELGTRFKTAMAQADRASVIAQLQQLDQNRGSWTNEDPNVTNDPDANAQISKMMVPNVLNTTEKYPISTLEVKAEDPNGASVARRFHFRYNDATSLENCNATDLDTGNDWTIHLIPALPNAIVHQLSAVRFTFTNLATKEVLNDCAIVGIMNQTQT